MAGDANRDRSDDFKPLLQVQLLNTSLLYSLKISTVEYKSLLFLCANTVSKRAPPCINLTIRGVLTLPLKIIRIYL